MSGKIFDEYPFEVHQIDESSKQFLKSLNLTTDLVYVGPKKYVASPAVTTDGLNLLNLQARPDDIWLFGYPRSGTTMTQELLWLIKNDLDFEGASKEILDHRFPYIDSIFYMDSSKWIDVCNKSNASSEVKEIGLKYSNAHYKTLQETSGNRFIKTHLPISLSTPTVFDAGCKAVYCARHPKDVIVSDFHCNKLFHPDWEKLQFSDFWQLFKRGLLQNLPWFEHVKEGWARRNDKNFLFLYYEDLIKNKKESILKIARFLDKSLTDEDVDKLIQHLDIEKFRKNKSVNNDHFTDLGIASKNKEHQFIRKGKVGGWKEYFTPALNADADKWIKDNLKNSDLKLPDI